MFCKPVHAVIARGGPPDLNHGSLTAKPSSHHSHDTLRVTPPTFSYPTHLLLSHPPSPIPPTFSYPTHLLLSHPPSPIPPTFSYPTHLLLSHPPSPIPPTFSYPTHLLLSHPPPHIQPFLLTQNPRSSTQRLLFCTVCSVK